MRASRGPLQAGLFVGWAVLAAAAVSHLVSAARGQGDVGRHWVFVAVNLAAAGIVLRRPWWAPIPIGALALQQLDSHGRDLVASVRGPGPFDFVSLAVVVFFPALVTMLVVERRRRTTDRTGSR